MTITVQHDVIDRNNLFSIRDRVRSDKKKFSTLKILLNVTTPLVFVMEEFKKAAAYIAVLSALKEPWLQCNH